MGLFKKQSLEDAVRGNNYRTVKMIIKKGVSKNEIDNCFKYSIHSDISIVEILFQNGANLNKTNHVGRAPLHNAAKSGYVEIIQFLLENGANINAKDNEGNTAIDFALEENIEQSLPSLTRLSSNSSKESKEKIIKILKLNGGVSGHSIDPQFRAQLIKRISALVFPARIQFPNESKDSIADKIESKLNYQFPDNMPDKEQDRYRSEIKKMILNEINKF